MSWPAFVDPVFLATETPRGFLRQVHRLLALAGFQDVAEVDGKDDKGADLIGSRGGVDTVFQLKHHSNRAATNHEAVGEAWDAMNHYGVFKGVVVTNTTFTARARKEAAALSGVGVDMKLWTGRELMALYRNVPALPPQVDLRPYQQRAADAAWDGLTDDKRALIYLATGLGKTVVAGKVISTFMAQRPDAPVLVTAHTRDLVDQLEKAMWRDIPKGVPTRMVGQDARPDALPGVTFAVRPTAAHYVSHGYRPELIVVDEAHHVGDSGDYAQIFDAMPQVPRLGVTATPWRGDGFRLEQTFGEPVATVSISDGMKMGYLAEVRYRMFNDNIDWDFVRHHSQHGYSIKELNKQLFIPERDEAVRDHLQQTWDTTVNPRAIVFCQTIEHAEKMARLLAEIPGWQNAVAIHGALGKHERRQRLLDFRSGHSPIITSVDLLNEGVDVPDVNIICFARVTHSRRIFVQQLGRGLRLRAGKSHVEVLDFVSDIRRLAEVMDLKAQVQDGEHETVSVPRNSFEFMDGQVESLMQQWIEDVGDLASADESSKLDFPTIPEAI